MKIKILHVCLANFYIDNYLYQENMLPKFHKKLGLDVEILASLESFDENGKSCLLKNSGSYLNEYNIPVTRLDYKKSKINRVTRRYLGTYEAILKSRPDIIFIHGCQFADIKQVVKFLKQNHNVKIYVDNHADFSNSATNFLSKNILHKVIWRYCAHLIEPYAIKFYGVLPARVDFLIDVYKIPSNKVELLVMGADDEKVIEAKQSNAKKEIREKYSIKCKDFLIVTGGKIDSFKKQTLLLMKAVKQINNDNIKLIVFGSVSDELKEEVKSLTDNVKIIYIGWVEQEDSYKIFEAADLVVFPGRHSVYWEQAVGLGKILIVKYWEGTTHIDLGGNVKFLYNDSADEIKSRIMDVYLNENEFQKMQKIADDKGIKYFSYSDISKRSIEWR